MAAGRAGSRALLRRSDGRGADALVKSFAREPEVHDPVRGRVKGTRAFEEFVTKTASWLTERNVWVEDVDWLVTEEAAFGEVVLYSSSWPLTGRHANRPPLLQADRALRQSDVVADYQRALTDGDVDAIVAAFEPDGYAREPAGGPHVHRGADRLRAFYERLFSNDGGIPLEHCAVIDDGRVCVLGTTSCAGASRSYRRKRESPSM